MLLGCLMKQPSLLTLPQFPLSKQDFEPELFHKIIYVAINKLVHNGIQEITEIEIENVVKTKPAFLEVLQDNNYLDFIVNVKELSIIDNYEYYYNTIRKFSLLRELQDNGFDIREFYDELSEENNQLAQFEKLTIQEILNRIEFKSQSQERY